MLTRMNADGARTGLRAPVLLTAALAASLAGCGGASSNGVASKSPHEIYAASLAAVDSATSVQAASVQGHGPLAGKTKVQLTSNGAIVQITVASTTLELIRIGDILYVKGIPAVYSHLGARGPVAGGQWLKLRASSPRAAELARYTELSKEVNQLIGSPGTLTKGGTTTVNGQKAIELKQKNKYYTRDLYIATTGKPYPVELLLSGEVTGQLTFSNWDKPTSLTPPANAVELSKL